MRASVLEVEGLSGVGGVECKVTMLLVCRKITAHSIVRITFCRMTRRSLSNEFERRPKRKSVVSLKVLDQNLSNKTQRNIKIFSQD
jgi:hypothetical protein